MNITLFFHQYFQHIDGKGKTVTVGSSSPSDIVIFVKRCDTEIPVQMTHKEARQLIRSIEVMIDESSHLLDEE